MSDERSCKDVTAVVAGAVYGRSGFAAPIDFDVSLGYLPSPLSIYRFHTHQKPLATKLCRQCLNFCDEKLVSSSMLVPYHPKSKQ